MTTERYYARSASDKTDVWPFWFVADRQKGGINVTADLWRLEGHDPRGAVLTNEQEARRLAEFSNGSLFRPI